MAIYFSHFHGFLKWEKYGNPHPALSLWKRERVQDLGITDNSTSQSTVTYVSEDVLPISQSIPL